MKYKIIASDYDLTLTNRYDVVPSKNFDSIIKYINLGGIFCINTGREKPSALRVYQKSPLRDYDIPLISHQGALIYFPKSNKTIHRIYLETDKVVDLCNYLDNMPCEYFVFCEENIIYTKESGFLNGYIDILNIKTKKIHTNIKEYLNNNDDPAVKVDLTADPYIMDEIIKYTKKHFDLTFTKLGYSMCELISNDASKGKALKVLADYYGIDIKDTIGIGDSLNDLSLIQEAGLGIAVGNAVDELKEAAKYIAPDSEEAAVSYIIEKVIKDEI